MLRDGKGIAGMQSHCKDDSYFDFISFYDRNAAQLAEKYESIPFESVHKDLLQFLPPLPARTLDVGAGSGRDAASLLERGYEVLAVEPSEKLRCIAARLHSAPPLSWLDDRLPCLERLQAHSCFDLILCSAVWMHLSRKEQKLAMERLSTLSAERGCICITFRTLVEESIPLYAVDVERVVEDAREVGFELLQKTTTPDWCGRANIDWCSLIFCNTGTQ